MNRSFPRLALLAVSPALVLACSVPAVDATEDTEGASEKATSTCPLSRAVAATASGDDGNVAKNVLDRNLATRWSSLGKGQYVDLDLGATKSACRVDVAFYRGDERQNTFTIGVSTDGKTFTQVFSGKSSGTSIAYESFPFTATTGRYVRITVNGNTQNDWASLTEVRTYAAATTTTPPPPPTSTGTTPPPPPPPPPPTSGGRPGPTNTGVPAGVTLVNYTGPFDIKTAGTVIDGKNIVGCLNIDASNVIVRRSKITCDGYYPLYQRGDAKGLLVEDVEIDGTPAGGAATSGIAFNDYTARRVNVHGTADGMKADANVLIEDSWIHDLYLGAGDHADGIQTTGGSNVTVRRSFIDIVDHGKGHGGDPNSCFQGGTEWAKNGNWTIDGNWLYGGGWVINFGGGAGNNKITNNRFGRGPGFPGYGPIALNSNDVIVSGNVWDDTGAPINP